MSLKQLIISAIIKVSEENPLLNHADAKTAIESRDQFIQLLMNELFPEAELETTHITVPVVPVEAPTEVPTPTKKRGPMTEEAKAAMKAKKAANAAKKAETPVPVAQPVVVEAPAPVEATTPTKKRGPMTEEAKAAMKAKKAANAEAKKVVEAPVVEAPAPVEPVPAPAKEKKPRAKKAAVPENANLAKIDPTWRKHLKAADKEHAKELEPQLLEYVNTLTNEEFHAKTTEAHVADFVASRSDGKVEAEVTEVDFEGKTYYVNPETNRVYEGEGVYNESTQEWTNMKPVGYVGMAAFTEMKL
jgi:glucan-binding YG repeat protein